MAECRERNAVAEFPETSDRIPRLRERDVELLPGIPNEVTLHHISTKLPWRSVCTLSLVSPAWKQAIHSRRVFDARVRSQSTETLVAYSFHDDFGGAPHQKRLALYSMRDNCCYKLPPIPELDIGIPWLSKFISLEGKIYLLGGGEYEDSSLKREEVYVLDLVGQRQWKQCASMQIQRRDFGCGVIGGKIYALGGRKLQSEVYDPEANSWSSVSVLPMPGWKHRLFHVVTAGDELLVYGGGIRYSDTESDNATRTEALFLEVYHPVKNEWTVVHPLKEHHSGAVFMSEGKFYLITQLAIYVHDTDSNSWRDLHSNLFPAVDSYSVEPCAVQVVDDELLMEVYRCNIRKEFRGSLDFAFDIILLQSKGFRSENKEIVWQEANCSELYQASRLCSVEL